MSDAVILAAISTLGTIVVAYFAMRTNQKVNKVDTKMDKVDAKVDDNTKITTEMKETVEVVKKQTDGVQTELAATKLLLGEAIGKELGRAEQKAETEANHVTAAPDAPIKVKVVNEPLKVEPTEPKT